MLHLVLIEYLRWKGRGQQWGKFARHLLLLVSGVLLRTTEVLLPFEASPAVGAKD